MGVIWLLTFIGHLYMSGGWLRADLIMETKKTCLKEIGLSAQKLLTILGSIVNIIWGERGGPMWPSNGSPQWTLKIHINLKLDPKLSRINPGFFKFVRLTCGLEYSKTFR